MEEKIYYYAIFFTEEKKYHIHLCDAVPGQDGSVSFLLEVEQLKKANKWNVMEVGWGDKEYITELKRKQEFQNQYFAGK